MNKKQKFYFLVHFQSNEMPSGPAGFKLFPGIFYGLSLILRSKAIRLLAFNFFEVMRLIRASLLSTITSRASNLDIYMHVVR